MKPEQLEALTLAAINGYGENYDPFQIVNCVKIKALHEKVVLTLEDLVKILADTAFLTR